MRSIYVLLVLFLSAPGLLAQSPVIDGVFDEWTPASRIAADPSGDSKGAFDVSFVSAKTEGVVLYVHFDIGRVINLQNGEASDGTLKLKLAANQKEIEIDLRNRIATNSAGDSFGWRAIGFQCLPTFASDKYEIRVDLSPLKVSVGDSVSLQFSGSDSLDQPVQIPLAEASNQPRNPINLSKPPGVFRIISQNTLHNGLAAPERQEQFKRLFKAVNADVYCFQEEWEKPEFMRGVARTVPQKGPVYVLWKGDCAIATTHNLVGLPMKMDRAVAGLVTTASKKSVVVISAHFECCGYSGSRRDNLRIQQAQQVVTAIRQMRKGAFGEAAKIAPVVLIGDFNLVGSRKPLDVINEAGLQDIISRTSDGAASTWRGLTPDERFWPGRLDLVAHDSGLSVLQSVILDSNRLTAESLSKLGLKSDDSLASDHLMLVCDFEFVQPQIKNCD